jgi:hypothetical protein
MEYVEVEVVLSYRESTIVLLETYESLFAAEFVWTMGLKACDCGRCEALIEAGVDCFEENLPCNDSIEDQQIKLVSIRPFILH